MGNLCLDGPAERAVHAKVVSSISVSGDLMTKKWTKGKSNALNWLRSHVLYEGDDCLIWPFGTSRGYGQVKADGRIRKPHRVMCEWVNGSPPTDKHEAAHSCGNGHRGCVNPNHLSWKTRAENHADAIAHGTAHMNKLGVPRAKLSLTQALEIRSLKGNLSQDKIAERFGVSHSTVAKIHRGELWRQ